MLGFLGFTVAAIVFAVYGITSLSASKFIKKQFNIGTYVLGYVFASFALLSWAAATVVDDSYISKAVSIGTLFLLMATLLFLATIQKSTNALVLIGATILAIAAFTYRVFFAGVDAVVKESVLLFNTPKPFAALLIIAFAFIWLNANKKFYTGLLEGSIYKNGFSPMYYSSNILAIIAVSGFLFAKKPATIIIAFTFLVIAYAILIVLNLVSDKVMMEEQ